MKGAPARTAVPGLRGGRISADGPARQWSIFGRRLFLRAIVRRNICPNLSRSAGAAIVRRPIRGQTP